MISENLIEYLLKMSKTEPRTAIIRAYIEGMNEIAQKNYEFKEEKFIPKVGQDIEYAYPRGNNYRTGKVVFVGNKVIVVVNDGKELAFKMNVAFLMRPLHPELEKEGKFISKPQDNSEVVLEKIFEVVRSYLPPNKISSSQAMVKIIALLEHKINKSKNENETSNYQEGEK